MEKIKSCFSCKSNYKDLLKLSCNHFLCQKCLTKKILKKHLMEIPDKDSLIIHCKCKNGSSDLSLLKIYDFLKIKMEIPIIKCKRHSAKAQKFCKECKIYLCEKCLANHSELFNQHLLEEANKQQKLIVENNIKCNKHVKEYTEFCKTCKISLCSLCINDQKIYSVHKDHTLIQYKKIIDSAKEQNKKMQFSTYDSFLNFINKIEEDFNKQFNENKTKTIKAVESLQELMKKFLEEFKNAMEVKFNKKKIIMYIIRKVYENYYNDFKLFNSGYKNIKAIKYLSKPYNEFAEIGFNSDLDNEIINLVNKLINKMKKKDINNSIKISYSYFSKKVLKLTKTIKNEEITGKNNKINDIILTKDGKFIIGNEDGKIRIYNKEYTIDKILSEHKGAVRSLCLLEKDRFASGSADKTLKIWCLKENNCIHTLKDHTNAIINLCLLPGEKLGSCSFREILIYNEHFKEQYRITEHQNWVRALICLDKERSASCSDDGLVKIYDKHFRPIFTFKDHENSVTSICYMRDGRIISGDSTGKMIVWSKNFSFIKEIKDHEDAVNHIIQLKDGRIVTCSSDKRIIIWDLDFKRLSVFNEHFESVNKLVTLREGGFASAGSDKKINIWK